MPECTNEERRLLDELAVLGIERITEARIAALQPRFVSTLVEATAVLLGASRALEEAWRLVEDAGVSRATSAFRRFEADIMARARASLEERKP